MSPLPPAAGSIVGEPPSVPKTSSLSISSLTSPLPSFSSFVASSLPPSQLISPSASVPVSQTLSSPSGVSTQTSQHQRQHRGDPQLAKQSPAGNDLVGLDSGSDSIATLTVKDTYYSHNHQLQKHPLPASPEQDNWKDSASSSLKRDIADPTAKAEPCALRERLHQSEPRTLSSSSPPGSLLRSSHLSAAVSNETTLKGETLITGLARDPSQQTSQAGGGDKGKEKGNGSASNNMIFSDFYKGPRSPFAKLRQQSPPPLGQLSPDHPDWVEDAHADLQSKDRSKLKEAIKRYLTAKVKNDWEFQWVPSSKMEFPVASAEPQQQTRQTLKDLLRSQAAQGGAVQAHETRDDDGYQDDQAVESEELSDGDDDDDANSVYSVVSEDNVHFQPRLEWASELSDDETPAASPYRFDNPEAVGQAVQASIAEKRALRRRAAREEMTWNEGLACFEARRNAWTGAKTVRVRAKPATPTSSSSPRSRRFFFRRSMSSSPPSLHSAALSNIETASNTPSDSSSIARDSLRKSGTNDSDLLPTHMLPVETLIPVGQPILPPTNPLRASITPTVYLNIYDKIILNNLQPSCPINLSDMLRACVAGWKRDGEWPPRPTPMEPAVAAMRKKKAKRQSQGGSDTLSNAARRMSFGLLGSGAKGDDARGGKGFRNSIQRAFGMSTEA